MELKGHILLLEDHCHTKCASRRGIAVQLQDHSLLCCGCREKIGYANYLHFALISGPCKTILLPVNSRSSMGQSAGNKLTETIPVSEIPSYPERRRCEQNTKMTKFMGGTTGFTQALHPITESVRGGLQDLEMIR